MSDLIMMVSSDRVESTSIAGALSIAALMEMIIGDAIYTIHGICIQKVATAACALL